MYLGAKSGDVGCEVDVYAWRLVLVSVNGRKEVGSSVVPGVEEHFEAGGGPGSMILDMPNLEFISANAPISIICSQILAYYM